MNSNVLWVLCGALLLGINAGVLGSFAFLRKRALIGDTLAHAALPGVTTAFMLTGSRSPFVIVTGAMVSAFLGMFSVDWLRRHTRIKEDSALAIVLSLFFALGVFQLTLIQKMPGAAQAGLDKLLFGQAASLVPHDLMVLSLLAVLTLTLVAACFSQFKLIIFDKTYAVTIGVPVRRYEAILALAVVLSVVIGLQLVGVVLVAALMLTPAAAARYWTNNLKVMLILAGTFGGIAGVLGALVSCLAPRMPTGPWMVVVVTLLFALALLFAPQGGMLPRWLRRVRLSRRIHDENVMRTLYKIGEGSGQAGSSEASTILHFRSLRRRDLDRTIARLVAQGFIFRSSDTLTLTESGEAYARRITRLHRLWELYLTQNINLPADHVHLDAEEIEHMLTPELEQRLVEELGEPASDPHGREIPPGETPVREQG